MTETLTGKGTGCRRLTDEEWERLAPLIPPPKRQGKRKRVTDRQLVDGLIYRAHTGAAWTKLPGLEDCHLVVVKRYTRWRDDGTLALIFHQLEQLGLLPEPEPEPAEEEPPREEKIPEWWELTDEQWAQLAPLMPEGQEGARYKSNREVLNVLLYREYTNTPWRELPEKFGPWRTIYNRYVKWKQEGLLDRVFEMLGELGVLSVDRYQQERRDHSQPTEWWELTDEQWQLVVPMIPPEDVNRRGKKQKSSWHILNALLYKHHTKAVWSELPEKYGPYRTIMERYRAWRDDGTLERVFGALGIEVPQLEDPLPPEEACPVRPERELQWWELTDEQWELVCPLLPPERSGRGKSDRWMLNALLYREYTNTPWRELPKEFGSWRSVYDRWALWKGDGSLERVFLRLKEEGALSEENYRRGSKAGLGEDALDWWELSDGQWKRIAHLFPQETPGKRGRKGKSSRHILNAILCRYYTGVPWLELPEKYGPWRTVLNHYRQWRDEGILDLVFGEINK